MVHYIRATQGRSKAENSQAPLRGTQIIRNLVCLKISGFDARFQTSPNIQCGSLWNTIPELPRKFPFSLLEYQRVIRTLVAHLHKPKRICSRGRLFLPPSFRRAPFRIKHGCAIRFAAGDGPTKLVTDRTCVWTEAACAERAPPSWPDTRRAARAPSNSWARASSHSNPSTYALTS